MSLPKEPRQLMINLMYLVLTALLALNVSAEILNAFTTMDEGMQESNDIVIRSNQALLTSIQHQAEAYPQYKPQEETALALRERVSKFCEYVESIKQNVIAETGGLDELQIPVGKKDTDYATRVFVEQGLGEELMQEVLSCREGLLQLIEDETEKNTLAKNLPLRIAKLPETTEKTSWSDFTFRQLPVAAALPLLTKFQADAYLSETSLLNHLVKKISAKPVHDEYKALISADKSYVIRGEPLNAEIFLGAYSSTTDNISVKVNNQAVPVRNGKAIYNRQANQLGDQVLDVEITARDPLNNKVTTYREQYRYAVGERSVTTSADKMNVFYVGVENPLSVSAAGVASEEVQVKAAGVQISKVSQGKYMVTPSRIGEAKVVVSGGGLAPTTFDYRVKRIPDPVAKLNGKLSGSMSPAEFKLYKKIHPHLDGFDFDAKCEIISFDMVRVAKNGDGFISKNSGNAYNTKSLRFASNAERGDKYYFENIKAKCPGDQHGRALNALFFKIK